MAFWNKKVENKESKLMSFSTPFGKIGTGNLSLPFVKSYGNERWVPFGVDNLYPQLINQCYYSSTLNGSIISYKARAVIGGGFEINSKDESGIQKVKEYTFIKKNKFNRLVRQITKDMIMHGRICILVDPTNNDISIKRVGPEKVRNNRDKSIFTLSDDWSTQINKVEYPAYTPLLQEKSIFLYELDDDAGQDYYSIPGYCSCLNDAFLDGEISFLQKSNIINSIYPSFMITMAKKFADQAEIDKFTETINGAKGAQAGGNVMAFVANEDGQLPKITAIPTNANDHIFDSTTQRVDSSICRAHSIDPLLMGIRVSGSLGSGSELKPTYLIFEKNVVMPLRELITECCDEILAIGHINATITINNYQIVDDIIVDKTKPTL